MESGPNESRILLDFWHFCDYSQIMTVTNHEFEQVDISEGIRLYLYPTDIFKSTVLNLFIHLPLDENATANAIIPQVLARGCKKYPNMRKIAVFLESLYGASFGTNVDKIGERHLLTFHFIALVDRFLPRPGHNLEKGLIFLKRLINEPLKQNNGFFSDYVNQEKQNLRKELNSLKDDKIVYARQRCIEVMCQDEPYRIYEAGRLEDIDSIDAQSLLGRWQSIIAKSPLDIFIMGKFSPSKVEKIIRTTFNLKRILPVNQSPLTIVDKAVDKERIFIEEAPETKQAKLVLGYRTYTTWRDEEIFPLMVFNGILGAYPHSKLFINVREKAGLAYYVSSDLERTKGLMLINAGISSDKFEPSVKIIKEQMDQIKQGNISDNELSNTIKSIEDRLKTIRDIPGAFIAFTLEQVVNQRNESLEPILHKIRSVTKDDVSRVARRVKLDTTYLLTGNKQ